MHFCLFVQVINDLHFATLLEIETLSFNWCFEKGYYRLEADL